MRILCVFARYNYGDAKRGDSYEYVNFIPALRALGHQVDHFDSSARDHYHDFRELNRALLVKADAVKPDAILAVQALYEIWLETWQLLRDAGALLIHWATDDSWKYEQQTKLIAPAFDICCTTSPDAYRKYIRDGYVHVFQTQWAASGANLRPPRQGSSCRFEVSFVGTAHGDRARWIRALGKGGIDVRCFGQGWPHGPIAAEEVGSVFLESRISLNFANSAIRWKRWRPTRTIQVKARNFEVPGAGGFLLTQSAPGLADFFDLDREVVTFDGPHELLKRVRGFLRDSKARDRIATAGWERVRREHTYEQRFQDIFRFAAVVAPPIERAPWSQLRWDLFDAAAQVHQTSRPLRISRLLLVTACSIIWGRRRGPRAARRAVFEVSWRVMGRRTYSAYGLPGRLFFAES